MSLAHDTLYMDNDANMVAKDMRIPEVEVINLKILKLKNKIDVQKIVLKYLF